MQYASVRGTGITLAALSAATFGTSGAFATSLIDAGWTPGAAVTARDHGSGADPHRARRRPVARAVGVAAPRCGRRSPPTVWSLSAGCQLFYFNAVSHLSVGVALLLEYLGTFLVVGWLWLRHGQRPRRLTVAGGAIAVLGLLLVLDLVGSHHLDPVGVLWGLGAASRPGRLLRAVLRRPRIPCRRSCWPGAGCASARLA